MMSYDETDGWIFSNEAHHWIDRNFSDRSTVSYYYGRTWEEWLPYGESCSGWIADIASLKDVADPGDPMSRDVNGDSLIPDLPLIW